MSHVSHFTRRTAVLIEAARESANSMQSDYVGAEHILHTLVSLQGSIAEEILREYGLTSERIHAEITAGKPQAKKALQVRAEDLPYSSRSKKVLEFAMKNSVEAGRREVTTGDILVGLMEEKPTVASLALHKLGITAEYLGDIKDEVTAKYEFNKEE